MQGRHDGDGHLSSHSTGWFTAGLRQDDPPIARGEIEMRFLIGVIAGFAAGMAAATLTGGKSSDEIRAEFDRFRDEIQKRDMDALGNHLEERFKELQGGLDERLSAISEAVGSAARDASAKAQDKADAASSKAGAASSKAAAAADAVEEATKKAD
jgi:gas vesicle protein